MLFTPHGLYILLDTTCTVLWIMGSPVLVNIFKLMALLN